MNVLSLFDGMSVAQQALSEIGVSVENYYASEIDPYAIAVTQSNYPKTKQLGSVVGLDTSQLPKIDLLIGGSPCQDLSIAKHKREGLKGSRSGLFWEFVRIRDEIKPQVFILENVASMPKEAKHIISEALGIEPVMINAALVSAQNRKRLFWVGKWNGEKYKQVEISQPKDRGILLKDILESDVDEKYVVKNIKFYGKETTNSGLLEFKGGIRNKDLAKDGKKYSRNFAQGDRVYGENGKSATLSANGGGRGAKTGLYLTPDCLTQHKIQEVWRPNGDSLEKQSVGRIRRLTPVETLRLQSMPVTYFDRAIYKGKPISNTQRYKMCGNAFNCEVIKHILREVWA